MKRLLIFTFSVIAPLIMAAQVQLMDLSVTPTLKIDTVTGNIINSVNTELSLLFKIKNEQQASGVHILFGTNQNIGDVLTVEANIYENAGVYYVSYNGIQRPISNYSAEAFIALTPQQLSAYNYITLYVVDNSGNLSNKLYFVK